MSGSASSRRVLRSLTRSSGGSYQRRVRGEAYVADRWVIDPYYPNTLQVYHRGRRDEIFANISLDFQQTYGPAIRGLDANKVYSDHNRCRRVCTVLSLRCFCERHRNRSKEPSPPICRPRTATRRPILDLFPELVYHAPPTFGDLAVGPSLSYSVAVVSKSNGRPVPGVRIAFTRTGGITVDPSTFSVTTDANGRAVFPLVALGVGTVNGTVTLTPPGGAATTFAASIPTFDDDGTPALRNLDCQRRHAVNARPGSHLREGTSFAIRCCLAISGSRTMCCAAWRAFGVDRSPSSSRTRVAPGPASQSVVILATRLSRRAPSNLLRSALPRSVEFGIVTPVLVAHGVRPRRAHSLVDTPSITGESTARHPFTRRGAATGGPGGRPSTRFARVGYDVAFDIYPYYPNMAGLLWRAGIPRRFGFATGGRGALYTATIPLDRRSLPHRREAGAPHPICVSRSRTRRAAAPTLLAAVGRSRRRRRTVLRTHGVAGDYVILHVGSGATARLWPVSSWRALARRLAATRPVVLTGVGAGEEEAARTIAADVPNCFNLTGRLDWQQLEALVAGAARRRVR